jgi:hypothetical protein
VFYAPLVADALAPRIPPPITEISRPFWTGGGAGQLLIQRCDRCARWVHPPTAACPQCDGSLAPRPVSGRGTVFTYTVNRHQFNPAVPVPYVIAIVELDEQPGLRFTTDLVEVEPEAVYIGMPVEVVFEAAGDAWVPLFRPGSPRTSVSKNS